MKLKKADAREAADRMKLVRSQSKKVTNACLAQTFSTLYADAQLACGGCPECCCEIMQPPYASPLTFTIEYPSRYRRISVTDEPLDPTLDQLLGYYRTLNLT